MYFDVTALPLTRCLQMYVGDYQKEFRRVLVNMREKCHLGETSVDTDDWTLFQNALKVIQICGELPHTYICGNIS